MSVQLSTANPAPEDSAQECRVYERQSCEIPTNCQPASVQEMKEIRWDATINDLSKGGLRIKLRRRFEKGTGLAVELPGDSTRSPSVVFVKVVHINRHEDGAWLLGCRFLSELGEDQLQRLVTANEFVLSKPKVDDADGADGLVEQ
jgi:hypothetical protein